MNAPRFNIGLPLLAKELTEQSARRRTYVIRVVYAVALYGFTLWTFWNQLGSWNSNSFAILGRGRELFEAIAGLQFAGLYLFLPAMTCGVLTSEKERDTLALLLLTKLGPWTIVFEKLLGRLVPMWSFLLLSMPLLAVAYSLGGVEVVEVINLAWALLVTTVQVGAFSILCSAWCRTTSAAFLATYLFGAAVILGPPILTQGGQRDVLGLVSGFTLYFEALGILVNQPRYGGGPQEAVFLLFGPWLAMHPASQWQPFRMTVVRSLPIICFSLTCLFAARVVLWRRAFVQPSNYIMRLFKSLDAFFMRANQNRWTKGIVLIHESVTLPDYEPIRWRETTKRSLGTTRYLIRMLLAIEVPVAFGMLLPDYSRDDHGGGITAIACLLWVIAALVLTVQSTALIGLERSRQTLDVLLTTQMSSEAIVREKFAGVWCLADDPDAVDPLRDGLRLPRVVADQRSFSGRDDVRCRLGLTRRGDLPAADRLGRLPSRNAAAVADAGDTRHVRADCRVVRVADLGFGVVDPRELESAMATCRSAVGRDRGFHRFIALAQPRLCSVVPVTGASFIFGAGWRTALCDARRAFRIRGRSALVPARTRPSDLRQACESKRRADRG